MDEKPQYVERVIDDTGAHQSAWSQTLEDMESIAEARREEGWDAVTLTTANTGPISRGDNDNPDRFGLVTVLPDNYAEEFEEMYESHDLDQYQVYSNMVEGFMYIVLEVLDAEEQTSLFLALRYDLVLAEGMINSALDEGTLYTHVNTIDGTELGTFEHQDYEALLPSGYGSEKA
jgi:hypothetical protein